MSASESLGGMLRNHGSEKQELSTENEIAGEGSRATGTLHVIPTVQCLFLVGMISITCPNVAYQFRISPPFLVLRCYFHFPAFTFLNRWPAG